MLQEIIDNFQKYVDESPLNDLIWLDDDGERIKLSESIDNYRRELNILKNKLGQAMNVVVMGEVKAGKSTLLNAIVGKKIAPTDVLEATAAISELYYSEEERRKYIERASWLSHQQLKIYTMNYLNIREIWITFPET